MSRRRLYRVDVAHAVVWQYAASASDAASRCREMGLAPLGPARLGPEPDLVCDTCGELRSDDDPHAHVACY